MAHSKSSLVFCLLSTNVVISRFLLVHSSKKHCSSFSFFVWSSLLTKPSTLAFWSFLQTNTACFFCCCFAYFPIFFFSSSLVFLLGIVLLTSGAIRLQEQALGHSTPHTQSSPSSSSSSPFLYLNKWAIDFLCSLSSFWVHAQRA